MAESFTSLKKHFASRSLEAKKIFLEFKKPIIQNIFFQNLDILRYNAIQIGRFEDKWHMKPDVFCLSEYGEPLYYPVILLTNNINTIFEFVQDSFPENYVLKPRRSNILKIVKYIKT